MTRSVTVLATGALTTVQDAGRPGQAALGVGRSGACDRVSYRLGNRLAVRAEGAAALEVAFGGLLLCAAALAAGTPSVGLVCGRTPTSGSSRPAHDVRGPPCTKHPQPRASPACSA